MRVPDGNIDELRENGFTIVEGFIGGDELGDAQDALWDTFPRPEEYHADPSRFPEYATGQFAGNHRGPFKAFALNRLTFHPDLVDLAERFLGSSDLRVYKTELWAKYSGAVDYDQRHHRDFGNHSLVVPKRARPMTQLTTFLLLSDVTEHDGPTKVVPLAAGESAPYVPGMREPGEFADVEVSVTGPAGTLFAYRTDILHRGSRMTGDRRARFAVLSDFDVWGTRWTGKMAWADRTGHPGWHELLIRATPRERLLFGFPAPGDDYWDEQTVHDVGLRYPGMDMRPYETRSR